MKTFVILNHLSAKSNKRKEWNQLNHFHLNAIAGKKVLRQNYLR